MNIKNKIAGILPLVLSILIFTIFPVIAGDLWNNEYYRAIDGTGELSELKIEDLDKTCLTFMENHKTDMVLAAVGTEDYTGVTLRDLAESYFNDYSYGYGENRDCIIFIADMDEEKAEYVTFGNADSLIKEDYLEFSEKEVWKYKEKHGVYGVLYSGVRYLESYLEDNGNTDTAEKKTAEAYPADSGLPDNENNEAPAKETGRSEKENGEAGLNKEGMPDWYVEDLSSFELFHNDLAPRVVDRAGIFTDMEEEAMGFLIAKTREKQDKDIVIYTDVSSYGKEHKVLAADFYEMNGYGCGENYEGMCLFICMDPDYRGWWACCTGPETRGLYTEDIADAIDDDLYYYMKNGNYGDGVISWINEISAMYEKGNPFMPDWMLYMDKDPERYHNSDALRIADDAGLFTEEEREKLQTKLTGMRDKYGPDFIVHTVKGVALNGMALKDYARAFYICNGYGTGDNYDGLALVIISGGSGSIKDIEIYSEGAGDKYLTEVNRKRLLGFADSDIKDKETFERYEGTSDWLNRLDHMERTGRVARSAGYWMWIIIIGILSGTVTGGVTLWKAVSRMAAPKLSTNADLYMLKESIDIQGTDTYINTTSRRTYSPVKTESSGGSSSHSSSYSSSYRSSSGHSHSGSGRRF